MSNERLVSDRFKVGVGVLVLIASGLLLLLAGHPGVGLPLLLVALATLGLAVGSLLVGTSGTARPV